MGKQSEPRCSNGSSSLISIEKPRGRVIAVKAFLSP